MKYRLKDASLYPVDTHLKIINALLEKGSTYTYTALYRSIEEIAKNNYIKIGTNKAKLFAKYYYQEAKYILKKDAGIYLVLKPH